jgi:hypothetical protein
MVEFPVWGVPETRSRLFLVAFHDPHQARSIPLQSWLSGSENIDGNCQFICRSRLGAIFAAVLILFLLLLCFFSCFLCSARYCYCNKSTDKATVVFPAQTMKKGSASLNFVKNYVNIFFMPPGRQGEPLFHCRAEKESTMQRKQ